MKTTVFLRERNKFKEVEITNFAKPEISDGILDKWQSIINIIDNIIGVSAGLIMKITPETMEVVLKSENEDNPYKVGGSDSLGHGLYCETVVGQNKELYIKNSLDNEDWKDNPDIDLDMISYCGLPIKWPDGEIFGTICILDDKAMELDENNKTLLEAFRNVIEDDLSLLVKQQEFKNFFDVNLDLLCIADTVGNFIKVNNAWANLLGYSKNDLEDMRFLDFVHPDDLESTLDEIDNLKNNQKAIEFVNRYKDKNGKYHYIEWNSNLKGDYIYASARDITDRVLQNKRLKQQKNRLNFILEGTNAGTWEWNIQTGDTTFNDKWAEMIGYTLEELKPTSLKTFERYIHPEDFKKAEKNLEKHFKGEIEQYNVEIRMKHKDGHWIWFNDRGRVISWTEDGEPLKMFGIHLDITKRKIAEEKIKKTKKSLENLSNQAPGFAHQYRLFPDGSFSFPYISDGVEEIYELTKEEVKRDATKLFDRIHPDDYERVFEVIQKSAENLSVWELEYRVVLPNKGLRWVEAKAKPEKLSDGGIIWYGNTHDITKRKNQEVKLKYQHKFTKTLAEISTDLLEINSANIDRKINYSLEKIGNFFSVDRSYIIQISDENELLSSTHEWCRKGVTSEKENFQNIPSSNFSWALKKLNKNQHLNIADVEKMSKKAEAEQKIIKELGIKSLVIIPMFNENELFGFFVFDTVNNKRKFLDEEIRLLKIFTDTIINAFSKHINDKKIRKLTYKDSLTGLYNRRFFEEELERIDTERQLPISIIVADINGLKIINDSLGHQKGDQLLKKAAAILNKLTREEDILARQGGDEFAILLPKTEKEKAEKIISRIKKKSKHTYDKELTVTIALGLAVKNNPDQDIEEVLKAADNDMYQNKLSESRSTKGRIVQSLLNTLEVKSNETKEHATRMAKLAFEFGECLNLSNSELNRLSLLSTLHDIGTITIDENILKKPGSLNDQEWKIIKEHPERGYKIANSSEEFAVVAEDIFAHHERWDGNGYPRKFKGEEIPYLARIISIIDAYDVMTNERSYKKAVSKKEALAEIKKCSGSQFDPELAAAFIEIIEK